jgi:drug/metabolite transporter (DMT)-like permease
VIGTRRASRPGPGGTGLLLATVSAATFGTSGTFASSLIGAGWSPAAAVCARIAVAALILTIPALVQLRGRWWVLRRDAAGVAAYGLIAVAGCQLFYFNAVARMPVGVALLLEYLGAVLVVGWLWLRYRQRPRRLTVAGAVTAVAGLVLVLNLAGAAGVSLAGVGWGLLAAVGLAIYFLLSAGAAPARSAGPGTAQAHTAVAQPPAEPLPPIVMAWAGMCVGAVALGAAGWAGAVPMAATTRPVDFLGHQVSWIVPVLGLSVVAAVIAYVAGIGAARRLGAKLASFIGMAEVLFAILFAWVLLGQLPSALQFVGGACILAGVTMVRLDELPGAGDVVEKGQRGCGGGPPPGEQGRVEALAGRLGRDGLGDGLEDGLLPAKQAARITPGPVQEGQL